MDSWYWLLFLIEGLLQMHYLHHYFSIFYFYRTHHHKKLGDFVMKLKYFLQILEQFDVESEIEFDVKSIETIEDFGRLSDVYSDDGSVIIELR